jgi:sodium-independent sulfate anion transporter 11
MSRGESIFSVSTADTFVEEEPTSKDWIQAALPSRRDILQYFYDLFPFVRWIGRYNLQWFIGDLVAGMLDC